jgi:hypothetical protein
MGSAKNRGDFVKRSKGFHRIADRLSKVVAVVRRENQHPDGSSGKRRRASRRQEKVALQEKNELCVLKGHKKRPIQCVSQRQGRREASGIEHRLKCIIFMEEYYESHNQP